MHFEGVDSAFRAWVNGVPIGYRFVFDGRTISFLEKEVCILYSANTIGLGVASSIPSFWHLIVLFTFMNHVFTFVNVKLCAPLGLVEYLHVDDVEIFPLVVKYDLFQLSRIFFSKC